MNSSNLSNNHNLDCLTFYDWAVVNYKSLRNLWPGFKWNLAHSEGCILTPINVMAALKPVFKQTYGFTLCIPSNVYYDKRCSSRVWSERPATLLAENSSKVHQSQVPFKNGSHSGVSIIFFLQISRHPCSLQTPHICMLNSKSGVTSDDCFFYMITIQEEVFLLKLYTVIVFLYCLFLYLYISCG